MGKNFSEDGYVTTLEVVSCGSVLSESALAK